ncbi:hypothetical protein SAMN05421736_11299 [Evansella caseinilytica]|uniref:Uncharacterized protein n=1 Tax=Evansella caseinilytica TaxID=1503961 RepID=A0A1H3SWQ0_9BACI|nr:hypothetical protein [Evansella caseinilytica]SDZ42436.1 hypothetical protein SAMN05421736_11299 [Evansella caseinilytica]
MKKSNFFLGVCIIPVFFFLANSDILAHEEPLSAMIAITKKSIFQNDIVVVWKNPNEYLVSKDDFPPFIEMMEADG